MSFSFAPYVPAARDARGPAKGATALMSYCLRRFGFASNLGIYVPRNIRGGSTLSHHAEGRALDIGIPMIGRSKADAAKGMQIVEMLGPSGGRLGIDHLIYNRIIWSSRAPRGRKYTGDSPHYDHIHAGLARRSADDLTPEILDQVLGPAARHAPPAPAGATHRVTATRLTLRREPSTSAPAITGLSSGTTVSALPVPSVESDGHRWLKVEATVAGRLQEGWVASEYLANVSPAPERKEPAIEPTTHRVTATSLRLRAEPTTTASIIIDLRNGATVQHLPAAARESDGHRWVKVKSVVDGTSREGWVASEYLEPIVGG